MNRIRVATYNIHRCIGTDGNYSADRIRKVLHQIGAQVVALQEVESGIHHEEVLDFLTDASIWQYTDGPTMKQSTARYGNAVLSSLPVIESFFLDLSYRDREPRGAVDLRLDHDNNILRIVATHLGLLPSERRAQIRRLLEWIGPPDEDKALTTVLMGDLNEWFLWGRPLKWLHSYFGTSPALRTYPTRWPLFSLDRIWAYPRQRLQQIEVFRTGTAKAASDHYPVIATLL